ncbi:NAD(P)/FAD-dependent oxidoreductase [Soehngenia saccharolytica]|nr:NAD(P)/FAD-dependent oxidoreductase [Soehngenia saccharolytica]
MAKVAVIGAGPSGIIASCIATNNGHEVTLFEKNNMIGKKLLITGKGRCNITNSSPIDEFFDNIVTNSQFLYSALYTFNNDMLINLLNEYGLEVKIERGNRVFPITDRSIDVNKALEKYLIKSGVNLLLKTKVTDVYYDGSKFIIEINDNDKKTFDKIILTTGGMSYPATGSTGDGYRFARKLGHTVVPLKASLVPMEIKSNYLDQVRGLSLKNVELIATTKEGKLIHKEFGEMIFTHFGISGPIVLTMSNYINKYIPDVNLFIDFKPALTNDKLELRILRDFEKYKNKDIKNALVDLLPKSVIDWIISDSNIMPDKKVNQITKIERSNLVNTIKRLELEFVKLRPIEEAIVTSGGVKVDEINPSTMESKIVPGLYFAGEIIDVDALTGGYNLQIAFSTGYLAGINI